VEGLRIELFSEFNDLVPRDEVRASHAQFANFSLFEIQTGHQTPPSKSSWLPVK
jgi:hypothetical protein